MYTEDEHKFPKFGGEGPDPETAVTRLWLALNKNETLPTLQKTIKDYPSSATVDAQPATIFSGL